MASLDEGSVDSLAIPNLASLQEHLLQHREPSPDALQPGMPEDNLNENTNHEHSSHPDDVSAEIPESANASRTPPRSHPLPRLSSSKSAPEAEIAAMVQPTTPSQEAFKTMTRAESFDVFPGGDTQPMESQVYRHYTESMLKRTTPEKTTGQDEHEEEQETNLPDGASVVNWSPNTYAEGEPGYINLAWQASGPRSESQYDDLLAAPSPDTQMRLPDGASNLLPETPGLAGHKHGRDGEILTSVTAKTPGYSQFFPTLGAGPVMSATQLFEQTQAPSSPMMDVPYSDPVVTRPSPNLNQHANVSSPSAFMSSPVATMHARPSGPLVGPRDNYRSMMESQEQRAARMLREQVQGDGDNRTGGDDGDQEDEDDDDDDDIRRQYERKMLRRKKSDQALSELHRLKAPGRPGSRQTTEQKGSNTVDLVTPAASKKTAFVDYTPYNDEEDTEDEAPLNEDDPEEPAEDEDDNDVYDELAQTVLRSQSNAHDEIEVTESVDGSVDQDDDREADAEPDGDDRQESWKPRTNRESGHESERIISNTQPSAIADSQPTYHSQSHASQLRQQNARSSLASYIPGSQYAGKTSQEQALLVSSTLRQTASQPVGSTAHQGAPSSPPLPSRTQQNEENAAEDEEPQSPNTTSGHEIPESDIPDAENETVQPERSSTRHSNPRTRRGQTETNESNGVFYSTARTHNSASGPSPGKVIPTLASQHSRLTEPSPRKAAGARHLSEIMPDPAGSGESSFDVDAIMTDVLTADDQEYLKAVGSPGKVKQDESRLRSRLTSPKATSKENSPGPEHDTPVKEPISKSDDADVELPTTVKESAEVDDEDVIERPRKRIRRATSKARELLQSTPDDGGEPKTTQESVKRREEAGAEAVSKLLSTRSTRNTESNERKTKKSANDTPLTASKLRRNMKEKSNVGDGKLKSLKSKRGKADAKETPSKSAKAPPTAVDDESSEYIRRVEADEQVTSVEDASSGPWTVTAPNRVLALFKGPQYNNFYPATWLSSSLDGTSQKVRFDDTTVTDILTHHVRALDLHPADQVKVDIKGLRNKSWIVKGFGPVAQTDDDRALGTDVFGRVLVRLQASTNRASLPSDKAAEEVSGEVVEVMITNIYITHTMWPHFNDRTFTAPNRASHASSRAETPMTGTETPDNITPGSRSRRGTVQSHPAVTARPSHLREDSVASAGSKRGSSLFDGMVFAISYGKNESEKANVTALIQRNGGTIVENGFDELFELPAMDATSPPTPSKTASTKRGDPSGLRLKPEYADRGFVALIADTHSRRAKYMQALALGLPTLSGKWITDSLDIKKNPLLSNANAAPLPWSRYLLAAGESAPLNGAVRSRTMQYYEAPDARLADTIGSRELLLNSDGVLIIVPKKSKAVWDRRKVYAFLTLAIGAGNVKRVNDLAEAKLLVNQEQETWQWVYVEGAVEEANAALFGQKGKAKQKRKRGEDGDAKALPLTVGDGGVKVVNDEFVLQSLILGALVD